jgi:hypothetical protein
MAQKQRYRIDRFVQNRSRQRRSTEHRDDPAHTVSLGSSSRTRRREFDADAQLHARRDALNGLYRWDTFTSKRKDLDETAFELV